MDLFLLTIEKGDSVSNNQLLFLSFFHLSVAEYDYFLSKKKSIVFFNNLKKLFYFYAYLVYEVHIHSDMITHGNLIHKYFCAIRFNNKNISII